MNKNILEFYGVLANLNIAKEEVAEFIHSISKWERATLPVYFETGTMSDEAKENLIQAADRQDAMNILVYRLKFNKSAIRQEINDAEERPKRLYGRRYEIGNIIRFMLTRHGGADEREKI